MLSSAKVKKKPHGDAEFSARKYTGPKQIRWFFDDETVWKCSKILYNECFSYNFIKKCKKNVFNVYKNLIPNLIFFKFFYKTKSYYKD